MVSPLFTTSQKTRIVITTAVRDSDPNFCIFFIMSRVIYDGALSFIHRLFCLTTGPSPSPKRGLHSFSSTSSFDFQHHVFLLRSSSSCWRLLPRLPVNYSSYISFNHVFWMEVPMKDVTNTVSLPYFCCLPLVRDSMQYFFILHTIHPNNVLHPSSAPHFKTFQVFLTYFPKSPIFSTIKKLCIRCNTLVASSCKSYLLEKSVVFLQTAC